MAMRDPRRLFGLLTLVLLLRSPARSVYTAHGALRLCTSTSGDLPATRANQHPGRCAVARVVCELAVTKLLHAPTRGRGDRIHTVAISHHGRL